MMAINGILAFIDPIIVSRDKSSH